MPTRNRSQVQPGSSHRGWAYESHQAPIQTYATLGGDDPPAMPGTSFRMDMSNADAPVDTGVFDFANSTIVIPRTGVYRINLTASISDPGGTGDTICWGYYAINGVQRLNMALGITQGFDSAMFPWNIIENYYAGDVVDFRFGGSGSDSVELRAYSLAVREIM